MNVNCADFKDDLNAYYDDELNLSDRGCLEQHLAICTDCRQVIDKLSDVSKLIAKGSSQVTTPEFWDKLQTALPPICELFAEDLSAYIDEELPPAAQEGIKLHLKECSPCSEYFQQLNSVTQLVNEKLELPKDVQVDLWAAVKSRLNEDCALIQTELSSYLDQEVSAIRHRAITGHLIDCPNCKDQFEEFSQVSDSLRNFYQPNISDDFDSVAAIRSKLQVVPFVAKVQPQKPLFMFNQRFYLATAVAVVVGLTGSLAYLFIAPSSNNNIKTVSAENYLLDSALNEPADTADAVVYGNQ